MPSANTACSSWGPHRLLPRCYQSPAGALSLHRAVQRRSIKQTRREQRNQRNSCIIGIAKTTCKASPLLLVLQHVCTRGLEITTLRFCYPSVATGRRGIVMRFVCVGYSVLCTLYPELPILFYMPEEVWRTEYVFAIHHCSPSESIGQHEHHTIHKHHTTGHTKVHAAALFNSIRAPLQATPPQPSFAPSYISRQADLLRQMMEGSTQEAVSKSTFENSKEQRGRSNKNAFAGRRRSSFWRQRTNIMTAKTKLSNMSTQKKNEGVADPPVSTGAPHAAAASLPPRCDAQVCRTACACTKVQNFLISVSLTARGGCFRQLYMQAWLCCGMG